MFSVIAYDGQVYGPVDVRTLIAWCQQGRIVASTHLVETATGRSFLAQDMPELAAVLAQSQPPSPQSYANPQPQSGQVSQQPYRPQPGQVSQQPYNPYQPQQNSYQAYPRTGAHTPPQQYPGGFPSSPVSYGYGQPKSRMVALLLCFFLGFLGLHRFYLGHRTSGIVMLIVGVLGLVQCYFMIIILIWTTIDMIRLASGTMADAQGVVPQ